MSRSRRSRRVRAQMASLEEIFHELRDNISREAIGGLLFVMGGYLALSLVTQGLGVPWLRAMIGWTAPLLALLLLLLGVILMVGSRAGYWSAQALVGAELLLLTLQVGTFAWHHSQVDWTPKMNGADGGLVGWALGSLLVAGLGQVPALAFLGLVGLVGLALIVRHTPLIYLAPIGLALFPGLARLRRLPAWSARRPARRPRARPDPAPQLAGETLPAAVDPPLMPQAELAQAASYIPPHAPTQAQPAEPPARQRTPSRASRQGSGPAAALPVEDQERLPPLPLLEADAGIYGASDTQTMARLIESTLYEFNVPVRVVSVESGPTVTQFGVEPQYLERAGQRRKIRVSRIANLADDLALALAAPAERIEAPVPGRPYVGIEVPNSDKTLVGLRGLLETKEVGSRGGILPMALGRDTAGRPVITDLARAPHLLIAGATGSGKSVCLNTIITGLLMRHGPESLNFIMVDPKMVELPGYNGIPHLLGKVITDVETVTGALAWLLLQMDDRYQLFKEAGVRNIAAYNVLAARRKELQPLPFVILVVDELADLMMTAPEEIEKQICRLAQMARATGIHLILATQRPSTDVVTGLIKANFPTRIAFAVTSLVDSRVILDAPGAEKLLGQGDMLLMRSDDSKLLRVQGCYVSDLEISRIAQFWRDSGVAESAPPSLPPWNGLLDQMDDEEELLRQATAAVRGMQSCSTSLVQRKLRVGYPKAARLMAQLEARGVVGPDLGGGQGRQVLNQADGDEDDEGETL